MSTRRGLKLSDLQDIADPMADDEAPKIPRVAAEKVSPGSFGGGSSDEEEAIVRSLGGLFVKEGATLRELLELMTRDGQQIALVVDYESRLRGLVTNEDLHRAILRGMSLEGRVEEVMNRTPVTGVAGLSTADALTLMRAHSIRHLPLVDERGVVVDLLVLENLLTWLPSLTTQAVIMAGGEGRRLQPLTVSVPKPLMTVGGKPVLEILIERLRQAGIAKITLSVHHKSEVIRQRFGHGGQLGVRIEYVEESAPLGTMGALSLMRNRLERPFFVVNGDILTKCDFGAMWQFHQREPESPLTVGVSLHQVDIPYGEFTLRGDRVVNIEENPRKEFLINAGIYLCDPSVLDFIPDGQHFDATELIRLLLDHERPVRGYLIREYWLDLGRQYDLEKANQDVAAGLFD
jgi:dTDP-glucose pyrophosphorylase